MCKEYIEREAAIEAIDNSLKRVFVHKVGKSIIDKIPAADVRPVVTCADCKHNNACLTQAFVEDASRVPFDRNTFFCADGERRSNA